MTRTAEIAPRRRTGPDRRDVQRLDAMRASRRNIERARGLVETIDQALASARSSLRWLDQATRAVHAGDVTLRDDPFDLARHVAGAAGKSAALRATIERLEAERALAAIALAEAEACAVGSGFCAAVRAIKPAGPAADQEPGQAENCLISVVE